MLFVSYKMIFLKNEVFMLKRAKAFDGHSVYNIFVYLLPLKSTLFVVRILA